MIDVVLADDHLVVLQGLRAMLEAEAEINVIGEASDGIEVLDMLDRLQPDVLVMDLKMPNLNGLETARLLKKRGIRAKVIILSMHTSAPYVVQALKYGVMGYVSKDDSADELVDAISQVSEGERYLSPQLSDRIIDGFVNKMDSGTLNPYDALTERERMVFQMVAEGTSNNEIAEKLSISPRTVETHRANMMKKLDLRSQSDLIRYAIREGILSIDD